MMRMLIAAAAVSVAFVSPALAGEMMTTTPELALPEPESNYTNLPHSMVTESMSLPLPEPEVEAVAPYKRCRDRETVYLTN
jgi:hypothetical protein